MVGGSGACVDRLVSACVEDATVTQDTKKVWNELTFVHTVESAEF